MGSQEFSVPVRGSAGDPISTSASNGSVETNNYDEGGTIDEDGSAYNYTVDPTETIQELIITECGNIDAEITTTSGTTFTIPLRGATLALDTVSIDSVVFKDPNGTSAALYGAWVGE